MGSPPAALGWGECLGTGDLSAIGSLDHPAPPQQSGILASLTAVYFRPLAISPTLPMTPHDNKNPLQELAQECNISRLKMNFKHKQYTAQLMVLELNTKGDNKFPLQPGAKVMDRLTRGDVLQREYQQLNLKEVKSDKE